MRANSTSGRTRRRASWLRGHNFAVSLATCFACVAGASTAVASNPKVILIWLANGVWLSFLLLAPRRRWPAYLCAGFAGQVIGCELFNWNLSLNLAMAVLNTAEAWIGAQMLRPRSKVLPEFTNRTYLARFLLFAVVTAPAVVGLVFAVTSIFWLHPAPAPKLFVEWFTTDALGMAVTAPACVAILQTHLRNRADWRRNWAFPALFAVVTVAGFAQTSVPLLFFSYPLLVLILMRLNLTWTAAATLFLAGTGNWFTFHGLGPFAHLPAGTETTMGTTLQLFIAFGILTVYATWAVLETQKEEKKRLEQIVSLHALVDENSRDAIILSDLYGHRTYVSAAAERLTGWTKEEFARLGTLELVHAEDLSRVARTLRAIRSGAEGSMDQFRVRKRDGGYIWIEASLRMVNDARTGAPTGVLNIVRDVTQRKKEEDLRAFEHSLSFAIHNVSLDGILVIDDAGFVVSFNQRFAEIWKVDNGHAPLGRQQHFELVPEAEFLPYAMQSVIDPDEFLRRTREIAADLDSNHQFEVALKDGRTLELYTTSLRKENGKNLGRAWFFRDVSERRVAEHKLQEAYRTVEALAATDALTGLANRRRFDEVLQSEWRRGLRDRRPLSLLMIDADHFKAYNDTYGHPRGDSCLRQIAEAALDVVARPGDLVARFGGEEFAVILPNTTSDGAMQLALEICESMRGRKLPHSGNPAGIVTVSVGCGTMVPAFGRHAVNLIEAADQALYTAKKRGRDQICNCAGGAAAMDSAALQDGGLTAPLAG